MLAGQAALNVVTVVRHVKINLLAEGDARLLDDLVATVFAHGLGGKVGVRASPVPVALFRLGIEGDDDVEVFGDAVQQPASDPQLVSNFEGAQWANLEFPLARHHFGVGTGD